MPPEPALRITDEKGRRRPLRRKLTAAYCRDLKPPASGRLTVYDERTPGLALVVTSKGHRAFYLVKKLHGRARRIKLADGHVAPEDVRKLATKTAADATSGTDPVAERRRLRARVTTLAELWETYGEERERSPRTVICETSLWKHISSWHGRRLDSIQPEDVAALHARIGKNRGRTSANRTVSLLRRVYRFAGRRRLYTGDNPAEGLEMFPERSRERYVKPAELPALLRAIDAEPDPWPTYFRLLLLTGARRSALASMRWADVDLRAGTWTIPAEHSKNKLGITVPLIPEAAERLQSRRETAGAEPHVFPAPGKSSHVVNPYEAWRRIRKAAGLNDLTMHDLRRTCGSYLAAAGVPLPIIGKALGHQSQSSTSVYARLDVADVRKELSHVADAMKAAEGVSRG